jgi:hypothetical protein
MRPTPARPPPQGPWPDLPWLLLGGASAAAPLAQGGDLHTALLAGLLCLALPSLAIEAMGGLGRALLAVQPRG